MKRNNDGVRFCAFISNPLIPNGTFRCTNKGNKADCNPNDRMVKREDGEQLAKEYLVTFMETSAKSGFNVEIAFMTIARYLYKFIKN